MFYEAPQENDMSDFKFKDEEEKKEADFVDDSTLVMVSKKKKGRKKGAKYTSKVELNPGELKRVDYNRLYS